MRRKVARKGYTTSGDGTKPPDNETCVNPHVRSRPAPAAARKQTRAPDTPARNVSVADFRYMRVAQYALPAATIGITIVRHLIGVRFGAEQTLAFALFGGRVASPNAGVANWLLGSAARFAGVGPGERQLTARECRNARPAAEIPTPAHNKLAFAPDQGPTIDPFRSCLVVSGTWRGAVRCTHSGRDRAAA